MVQNSPKPLFIASSLSKPVLVEDDSATPSVYLNRYDEMNAVYQLDQVLIHEVADGTFEQSESAVNKLSAKNQLTPTISQPYNLNDPKSQRGFIQISKNRKDFDEGHIEHASVTDEEGIGSVMTSKADLDDIGTISLSKELVPPLNLNSPKMKPRKSITFNSPDERVLFDGIAVNYTPQTNQ